jgi:hypothetical protein
MLGLAGGLKLLHPNLLGAIKMARRTGFAIDRNAVSGAVNQAYHPVDFLTHGVSQGSEMNGQQSPWTGMEERGSPARGHVLRHSSSELLQ